jgi:hypothetical protein
LIDEQDSKESVSDVSRRSDERTQNELKKCGAKSRGEKREVAG